jgi:hypothetical protein
MIPEQHDKAIERASRQRWWLWLVGLVVFWLALDAALLYFANLSPVERLDQDVSRSNR